MEKEREVKDTRNKKQLLEDNIKLRETISTLSQKFYDAQITAKKYFDENQQLRSKLKDKLVNEIGHMIECNSKLTEAAARIITDGKL